MPGDGCVKQPVALGVAVCRKLGHTVFRRRGCLRRVRLRVVPEPCTSSASLPEMSRECTVDAQSPCACRTFLLLLRRRGSSRASYSCVRTTASVRRLRIITTIEACRICRNPTDAATAVAKKVLCALHLHVCNFFRASVAFALCRPFLP